MFCILTLNWTVFSTDDALPLHYVNMYLQKELKDKGRRRDSKQVGIKESVQEESWRVVHHLHAQSLFTLHQAAAERNKEEALRLGKLFKVWWEIAWQVMSWRWVLFKLFKNSHVVSQQLNSEDSDQNGLIKHQVYYCTSSSKMHLNLGLKQQNKLISLFLHYHVWLCVWLVFLKCCLVLCQI